MEIKIKKLRPDAKVPTYATDQAACFDLYAATVAGTDKRGSLVTTDCPVACGTGLAFEIPPGWAMLLFSRSGYAFKHDARLANSVGVIDSDYRGEVLVKVTRDVEAAEGGSDPLYIRPGYRVAQAMIIRAEQVQFALDEALSETARGSSGFGDSGY